MIIVTFFHPMMACCFACLFGGDVVVGMVAHVVTDAIVILMIVVTFMVIVTFFTMIVMVMSPAHHGNGHVEGFNILCLEFKNVMAGLKVVN